ncbi:MAG: Ppx/GppA family phosphatase [Syntrophaceae bacterium]|nr:Ppx/GppA family phosphatase [Syntrophaceae bacterium]
MKTVASIDVGTNTILLLVATVEGGRIKPLLEKETIVRLGEGVQKDSVLYQDSMKRGFQTLARYMEHCQSMGVQKIFAVGTSALREARNSEAFIRMVKERLGLSIEIISGEEEARLSFLAVAKDLKEMERSTFVIDIGGGSTEFILGRGEQIAHWMSLPLGSVRFTERHLLSDPVREEEWKEMEREIRKLLTRVPHPRGPFSMVAVGGTATTLASVEQGLEEFIPEKIHHFVLKKESLRNQLHLYRSKTIAQRKTIPGLPPDRADVILAGGAILLMAMEKFGVSSLLISCHGVRYGVLYKNISDFKFQISD